MASGCTSAAASAIAMAQRGFCSAESASPTQPSVRGVARVGRRLSINGGAHDRVTHGLWRWACGRARVVRHDRWRAVE
jgi:hypothetical protein